MLAALALAATRGCPATAPAPPAAGPAPPASEKPRPASRSPLARPGRFRVALVMDDAGHASFGPLEPAVPGDIRVIAPAEGIGPGAPAPPAGTEVIFLLTVASDGSIQEASNVGAPTVAPRVMALLKTLMIRSRFEPYAADESATIALAVRLETPPR